MIILENYPVINDIYYQYLFLVPDEALVYETNRRTLHRIKFYKSL